MADVRLAAGVGQHLEHVGLRLLGRGGARPRAQTEAVVAAILVRHLPRALVCPHRLPAGLDRVRVVFQLCHPEEAG